MRAHIGQKPLTVTRAATEEVKIAPARRRPNFPFSRIAGQTDMKLALLLNVVDPGIGGVLIMGDRGCGKSVAVRSIVDLLPLRKCVYVHNSPKGSTLHVLTFNTVDNS